MVSGLRSLFTVMTFYLDAAQPQGLSPGAGMGINVLVDTLIAYLIIPDHIPVE
jgi:hypothetical protein